MLEVEKGRVVAAVSRILESVLAPLFASALVSVSLAMALAQAQSPLFETFAVPAGSAPHDVAPAPDGTVWYTAQAQGAVGRLDPRSGKADRVQLGAGSAPHGVIVGPDGAAWITDGGQNAILRVDPKTLAVTRFPLPKDRPNANLNTAVFDKRGHLWFTGQSGIYGELDPARASMRVFDAPRGPGPYGICVSPDGSLYFASLAGSYLGRIDPASGAAQVICVFRVKLDTHSTANWTLIPRQSGRRFQRKLDTDSASNWTV